MIRRPPRSTRTDTLFPYTTRFRSEIVGDLKEGIEQGADARAGVAVELQRMILDALGAKAGDDDDVLDPVRDERRDLPADQAATVELDQAFGDVAGQRQQARTLPGRQDEDRKSTRLNSSH